MTACWEWPGGAIPDGYGQVQVGENRGLLVHRLIWEMLHGKIKPGHLVHHICCNKRCVNPEHLMAVTASEHMRIETRGYAKRKWFGPGCPCPTCGSDRVYSRPSGSGFKCRDCDAKAYRSRKEKSREQLVDNREVAV